MGVPDQWVAAGLHGDDVVLEETYQYDGLEKARAVGSSCSNTATNNRIIAPNTCSIVPERFLHLAIHARDKGQLTADFV